MPCAELEADGGAPSGASGAAEAPPGSTVSSAAPGSAEACRRQAWARLLKKVFEVEPLVCPRCGEEMVVLAWITDLAVVDRILRHRRQKGRVLSTRPSSGSGLAQGL